MLARLAIPVSYPNKTVLAAVVIKGVGKILETNIP
jgi:hypothetical protein